MKTTTATIMALLVTATQALATGQGSSTEGLSLFATLFMAFGVMIVLFQLIPGIMLFVGMLKGLFSATGEKSHVTLSSSNRSKS